MATTIRYPSGLSLGLAKGIPLAFESGFDAYERARDRERQDLLTRLHVQQLQQAIQEQQARQVARVSLPTTLQTLAGLAEPGPAAPQSFTMPLPEAAPGVDTPLPPASTPGLLAGVEGPGLSMTLPGARPQAPRTTAELLQKPGAAEAVSQGLLAGIHPIGAGGVFDIEGHAKRIKTEEDKAQAVKNLREGWREFADAPDWKGQAAAMGKVDEGLVLLGHAPNLAPLIKVVTDQRELEAMKEGFNELQPIIQRLEDHADTPQDRMTLARLSATSKSVAVRERTDFLFKTSIKAHGPELQLAGELYALKQQNPALTYLDAWQQIAQRKPQLAMLAETTKHVPPEVVSEREAKASFAKGKAGEEGRRAGVPPEEKKLEQDIKQAQLENLQEGPGEKAAQRDDTLIKSYASQYEDAVKKYAPLGALQGWPPMSKSMFDALRLPDALYQTVYGTKKPSKKALLNQRVEELYRARHPGQQLLPGSITPKERAEFEQILTSEDLLP